MVTMKKNILMLSIYFIFGLCGLVFASDDKYGDRNYDYSDGYEVKLYGTIETIPKGGLGVWLVNGKEIIVNKNTFIEEKHGEAVPGAYVEVKGFFTGKEFVAREVEVKRDSRHARIYGVVEKIPATGLGIWIINGKEVSVTKDTIIDEEHGKPVVGAYVEVKANYSRGIYSAKKIEVKRGAR